MMLRLLRHCVAVHCNTVWQCVAVCCSVLQCVAVCCSVLQCIADDRTRLFSRRYDLLLVVEQGFI